MKALLACATLALAGGALAHGCATAGAPDRRARIGRRTVAAKCGSCHLLPRAKSLSPAGIEAVLASHADRLRLDPRTAGKIRTFLVNTADDR